MTTTVTYHADYGRRGHPAINVKLHLAGLDFWPPEFLSLPEDAYGAQEIGRTTAADLIDAAYNIVQEDFWDAADKIAAEVGLGSISCEGRSGGWLVIDTDPTDGGEDDAPPDWLDGYTALVAWCQGWLSSAPRKVRDLALDLAMREVGERAAYRMFDRPERLVTA